MARTLQKKRKRKRRRKRILVVVLIIIALLAVTFLLAWKVFVVEKVNVEGNEIYSDEQISEWVLDDDHSWNSLYVFFKSKFSKQDEIPFVDTMDVTLDSPTELTITVTEKGILGYTYVPSAEAYAYFDQDGFVVELSDELVDDVMRISGLSVEQAKLYEKLDIDSPTLKTLLTLTQLLVKYNRQPEVIYINDNTMLLSYGDIQVDLGASTSLTAKILRMDEIMGRLGGESGTLHLDTVSDDGGDIYFKPGEMVKIPDY
ncbi:MAG: cell division protein FtsQ [Clostridiales bacterium]|nr:cell division protein FtsQ [Clostridiales bacterium]